MLRFIFRSCEGLTVSTLCAAFAHENGSLPYGGAPEAAINDCRLISLEDDSRRGGGILGRLVEFTHRGGSSTS